MGLGLRLGLGLGWGFWPAPAAGAWSRGGSPIGRRRRGLRSPARQQSDCSESRRPTRPRAPARPGRGDMGDVGRDGRRLQQGWAPLGFGAVRPTTSESTTTSDMATPTRRSSQPPPPAWVVSRRAVLCVCAGVMHTWHAHGAGSTCVHLQRRLDDGGEEANGGAAGRR